MTRPEPQRPEPRPARFSTETEFLLAELNRRRMNALVAEEVRAGRWPVASLRTGGNR